MLQCFVTNGRCGDVTMLSSLWFTILVGSIHAPVLRKGALCILSTERAFTAEIIAVHHSGQWKVICLWTPGKPPPLTSYHR